MIPDVARHPQGPERQPRFDLTKLASREHLLDHQLWCIGCDIRRGDDLPLTFGFERFRSPEAGGATAYAISLPGSADRMIAWGFGLTLSGDGVPLFVRRHPFSVEVDDRWDPMALGGRPLPSPMARRSVDDDPEVATRIAQVCALWEDYEEWVEARLGRRWRRANWMARPRRVRRHQGVAGQPLAPLWRAWRERLQHVSLPSLPAMTAS